jgi:hypothetical protein
MQVREGSCLCGGVRIRAHGELRGVVFCHCSQCRKQTGLYYAATELPDDRLEVQGSEQVSWFAASETARRAFCKTCGSALFWKSNGSDKTSVMAGLFDQPSGLAGEKHIFVEDKADFYTIVDDLPQAQSDRS